MIRLKSLLNINEIWNISGHSSPHGGKVFPEIIVDYDRGLTSIRAGNEEITVSKRQTFQLIEMLKKRVE